MERARAPLPLRARPRVASPRGFSAGRMTTSVVVACSEVARTGDLLASMEPVWIVQSPGGLTGPRSADAIDPGARASIEYASRMGTAQHVIVCGHSACSFASGAPGRRLKDGRGRLLAQVRALLEDPLFNPRLRAGELSVRALWIDDEEGEVFVYDPRERLFERLDEDGLEAFIQSLEVAPSVLC